MPINKSVSPQDVVDLLNWLIKNDPVCATALLTTRFECKSIVANHPTIQAMTENVLGVKKHTVSILGVLNGVFGVYDDGKRKNWGCIAVVREETSILSRAEVFENEADK